MKLSDGIESAIHCAVVLGRLDRGAVLPAKDLAELHGVSESYLLKHLQALTRAGITESVPGPSGGYRLAREPQSITMLDFVDAIEGPQPAFRCKEIRQRGPLASCNPNAYLRPCLINAAMLRAESAYREALRGETLQEILDQLPKSVNADSLAKGAEWLQARQRPMSTTPNP